MKTINVTVECKCAEKELKGFESNWTRIIRYRKKYDGTYVVDLECKVDDSIDRSLVLKMFNEGQGYYAY